MPSKTKPSSNTKMAVSEQYPLVPLDMIEIVERPEEGHEDQTIFFNPRSLDSFSPDEMAELRRSIAENGLQQPPIVRFFTEDGKKGGTVNRVELIAGERRLRSIQQLVAEDAPCQTDDGVRSASEVFAKIPCKVHYNITDEMALRLAFLENGQHKSLSTQEEIALVERLTRRGLRQEEISDILDTNVTWVSQTSNFRTELPGGAFERLLDGRLSRHVAVKMLSYHKEDRDTLFQEMLVVEEKERQEAEAKLQDLREMAEDEEDLAARDENQAIEQRDGKRAKAATRRRSKAQKVQKQIDEKQQRLTEEKGVVRQGHLQRAAQRKGINPKKVQLLSKDTIQQFYVDLVGKWIENGKIDPVSQEELPAEVLEIVRATASAILRGIHDPMRVVRYVMVERGEWTLPEDYEGNDDEYQEAAESDEE